MSKGTTGFHTLAPEINPSWLGSGTVDTNYNFAGQLLLAVKVKSSGSGGKLELHVCYHEPVSMSPGSGWITDPESSLNDFTNGTAVDFTTVPNSFNFTYYNSNPDDVSWYEPAFNDLLQSNGIHRRGYLKNSGGDWSYRLSSMSAMTTDNTDLYGIRSVDDLAGALFDFPGYDDLANKIKNNAFAKGVIWNSDGITPHSIFFISPYIHITGGSSSSATVTQGTSGAFKAIARTPEDIPVVPGYRGHFWYNQSKAIGWGHSPKFRHSITVYYYTVPWPSSSDAQSSAFCGDYSSTSATNYSQWRPLILDAFGFVEDWADPNTNRVISQASATSPQVGTMPAAVFARIKGGMDAEPYEATPPELYQHIQDTYTGPKVGRIKQWLENESSSYGETLNIYYPIEIMTTHGDFSVPFVGGGSSAGARASAGSAASILPRPASTSVTAPSAPASTSLSTSGGSIFLAHSAANPAPSETDMIPQPSDFLSSGTSSSVPTNPFTFTGVTNNALNTIYYFLMDAAQNISFQDKLSFYNDQDAPVITPDIPSAAAPYTEIWLGPNKPHLNGTIEINDNPMGGETSTAWDVSMRRPPPLQAGESYNTDAGADPSLTGYTESTDGVIRHIYGAQSLQMNDAGDEIVTTVGMHNVGLLIYQYTGTGWHIATGETTQGMMDSTLGGHVNNVKFSKGSSDYLVYQNAFLGKCLVYKKVMGSWNNNHNAVWSSLQIHPSSAVGSASCTLDTSIGLDRFVCMTLNDTSWVLFTVYKKDSGDSWSTEQILGPIPFGAGFSGVRMTDDGSRVVTTGDNGGAAGTNGKIYVWTRSGTTWTQQADVSAPTPILSGSGSSVMAAGHDYSHLASNPFQMGRGGFDISSDGEWLITGSGEGSYNSLSYDGGEILFFQWTGSTYTLRQRIKVSSFCDYGNLSTSMPDGATPIAINGDGTRAVVPIKTAQEHLRGREKLWVFERSGSTWAIAKYLTLANPAPWSDTGTLVTSGNFDYMSYHASAYQNYPNMEGYKFSLGEGASAINKAGNVIASCTALLNYRFNQQPGAVVWRL